MSVKVIITISFAVTVAVTVVLGAYALKTLIAPVLAPRVELLTPQFSDGPCQTNYVLWVIPWGQDHTVTATFVLKNTGLTDGHVKVAFTSDGGRVGEADFFIGAGQTEQRAGQFQVNNCEQHGYWAQIESLG